MNNFTINHKIFNDYNPLVTSATAPIDLFATVFLLPSMNLEQINKSPYYARLNKKSVWRSVVLCFPVIGNVTVAIYDFANQKYSNIEDIPTAKVEKKSSNEVLERKNLPVVDYGHALSAETAKILENSPFARFFPPLLPTSSNRASAAKMEEWINAHPENLQKLAREVTQSICHITHEKFMESLILSVRFFNDYLDSVDPKLRDYTIVIPKKCPRPRKGYERMSNLWVTMLALPYLKYPPKEIFLAECASGAPNLPNIGTEKYLLFDDASYSGSQISEIIQEMGDYEKLKYPHIIIPFMTDRSVEKIGNQIQRPCWIAAHTKMDTLEDIFKNKGDLEIIVNTHRGYPKGFAQGVTLTCFDHKIADLWSLSPLVSKGYIINSAESSPFITDADTPYKKTEWASRK